MSLIENTMYMQTIFVKETTKENELDTHHK
jgi:hypothetical protein